MTAADTLKELETRLRDLEATAGKASPESAAALSPVIEALRSEVGRLRTENGAGMGRWERVQLARAQGRPTALDYVERLCTEFHELHGDRRYADDPALLGGPARWNGEPVMLLLQQKGRDTKSKIKRRFGSANPEGYRKAVRLMDLADKFGLPVVALVDTQGAYPGLEAEDRGQGWAIAESIRRMLNLRVPVVSVVIGEGGSGGALAVGVGNRVLIQENAWYSVISPEGAASIIWKDATKAPLAAEALKLTAPDLLEMGIVEEVIAEPAGGAHLDMDEAARAVGEAVTRHLKDLSGLNAEQLLRQRHDRFRALGAYTETDA